MRFADPQACPDCRGALAGQSACPHCGLDLTSAEVRQLWQTLLQADELLARATLNRDRAVPAASATRTDSYVPQSMPSAAAVSLNPQPATGDPFTPYPRTQSVSAPRRTGLPGSGQVQAGSSAKERRWSVGTILLTLGAFGLIVAGFIFITRSWGDLGLVGRTLVLLGVTAGFLALGMWVTQRPLRASAEAVWSVVLALLTLDFFAARHEGMLGLDGMSTEWAWLVWGVVLVGLGVLVALLSRKPIGADLVSPALVGGVGIVLAGIGTGAVGDDWDLSWRSILALVVAGALALATRPARLRPLTIAARVVVTGFFVWSYVVATVDLVDHPGLEELVRDGHAAPMAVMALAAVAAAWLVRPVRIWALALAVVAACGMICTPAADEWQSEGLWLAVAGLAALLGIAASRGASDWIRGVRVGAAPVIAALLLLELGLLANVFEAVGQGIDDTWSGAWDMPVDARWADAIAPWVVVLVLGALLVVAWFVPRWPELTQLRPYASSVVVVAAGVGVLDAVVAARLPLWAVAALLLAAAGVLLAAHARGVAMLAGPTAAVLVGFAAAFATSNQGVSALTWIAGSLILAASALTRGPQPLRQAYAVGGVGLVIAGLTSGADLMDPPAAVPGLAGVIASLALLAAAGLWWRDHPVRLPVEAATTVTALVALVADGSSSELAVRWTIVGVVVIGLSFVVPQRRWYLWPGGAALVVAYVLLIVDSGFSFVEAYTLPLGAVALAVGLYVVWSKPEVSTWLVVGPGLAVALLPSVPQALADPTELRALLLGLGAIVALALGIRFDWQAPFVFGVMIITLLVLFNIGPYANAAPRVVLIAAVSAVLLGFGITWEDRVRDGRKLVGYVRSMR
jgi:hypothetical protein